MYAHVQNGTVDAVQMYPPEKVYDGTRWWDLRTKDATTLAQVGWYLVNEASRPADTATTKWDPVFTPGAGVVVQSWTEVAKSADELAAQTASANAAVIRDRIRGQMQTNLNAITQLRAYGNATGSQTTAQLTASLRDAALQIARAFEQLNGLGKLELRELNDTTGT